MRNSCISLNILCITFTILRKEMLELTFNPFIKAGHTRHYKRLYTLCLPRPLKITKLKNFHIYCFHYIISLFCKIDFLTSLLARGYNIDMIILTFDNSIPILRQRGNEAKQFFFKRLATMSLFGWH